MVASETATLANGCFWCTEAVFKDVIGVSSVQSGYIGGTTHNPTYEQVCGGRTGHAEAVRITFDPEAIAFDDVLDIFFATHDPSQLNRQGNDVGTQYRSAIFYLDAEQKAAADAAKERAQEDWDSHIVTTVEPASMWYSAEDYHQEYFANNANGNPYCQAVVAPKLAKFRKQYAARLKKAAA